MGDDRRGERAEESFEVVPTRIGGSSGRARSNRRRRAPIIAVIAVAALVPAVAWVGPHIEWRPELDLSFLQPTPTAVPSTTPRPTFSPTPGLATPAPALTVGVGPHPTEPFPVDVGGLRLADPTTGELGRSFGIHVDNDAVFTSAAGDGWWCVCFIRQSEPNQELVTVEVRRLDRSGTVTQRRTVAGLRSVATPPAQDFSVRFDLEVSPDEKTAYLASATRSGDRWAVTVEAIDLTTLEPIGSTDLGTVAIPPVAGPTPSPDEGTVENYFAGPYMRLSPDGRQILLWAWVDPYSSTGVSAPVSPQVWRIDLDQGAAKGSVGALTQLGPELATRLRTCYWVSWMTVDELAAICWPSSEVSTAVTVSVLAPDGTEKRRFNLFDADTDWVAEPLLDRANRWVFVWQPANHTLRRLDLDGGKIDDLKVDPAATVVAPSGPGGGQPGSGRAPDWVSFGSDLRIYYGPQLVAEPGSARLFGLGVIAQEQRRYSPASSGVWVFDSRAMTLLDRWSAVAAYSSIGLSADGRWLMAAAASGVDEDGNPTAWEASLTVYDVSDGRPALQLGRLGVDVQVLQVPP